METRRLGRWFLPQTPDVLGTLCRQSAVTMEGLTAFVDWSAGSTERAKAVRDAEHAADDVRRQLQRELREAFTVPIDAEDLYTLSERLDAVLNGAKDVVREADVMGMQPDSHLATMAQTIHAAVEHIGAAFEALRHDHDRAVAEADAAITTSRQVEKTYRVAMSQALQLQDVRALIGWRELYRRYARLGDQVARVADRVWYAVVKHA